VRPPHGVVVLAGGKRVEVRNTGELTAEVLAVAEKNFPARQRDAALSSLSREGTLIRLMPAGVVARLPSGLRADSAPAEGIESRRSWAGSWHGSPSAKRRLTRRRASNEDRLPIDRQSP
jgi:hypothetical protein